jgi:hypothetical protein
MRHLSDGTLRRMQDEPLGTTGAEKDHFDRCESCHRRAIAIATEAERAGMLLAVPAAEAADINTATALAQLRRRAAGQPAYQRSLGRTLRGLFVSGGSRTMRPAAALALACALGVTVVATGVAENFVKVFEPTQFQAVQVQPDSLRGLPDLSQFGDMKFAKAPKFTPVADAGSAEAMSGITLKAPSDVATPTRAKGTPAYVVMNELQASFTFNAAKAEAWAKANNKTLPPMPPGLDGSTLSVSAGPGVLAVYGGDASILTEGAAAANHGADRAAGIPSAAPQPGVPQKPGAPSTSGGGFNPSGMKIPAAAIVEMKSPVVTSSGASVTTIESYLLALPGFPPDLASQIRAIGDPATTLPVPVPTGQESHQVDINGASGLFVGDSTGLGSGVVWTRDGILYATVGTMTESEVTGMARSVH